MSDSSRTQSSKISPTHSRSSFRTLGLLTVALLLAFAASAAPQVLTAIPTKDQKVVRRWSLPGGPRGVTIANGLIYVGLADRQAIAAIDPKTGAVVREHVLDSAEIAATKELVTVRTNPKRDRLYIANGSDESAMIVSVPDLAVVREITLEGEPIRDVVPDPKGRYLFVLGRRLHVFDSAGSRQIRTLDFDQPMAIAASNDGQVLAVFGTEDFGNTKATVVAIYDLQTFAQIIRDPMQTEKTIDAAMFAAGDTAIVALSRDSFFEKAFSVRPAKTMDASSGKLRMHIGFGDLVNSVSICLPTGSGPQIAVAGATAQQVLFAERRCASSGAFVGSQSRTTPASLYGVNAYALAFDPTSKTLVATDKAGFLTIYKLPK